MTRFVLVPGACHGGWWWQPVVAELTRAGHTAEAVTLSGLDPSGPPAPAANLDTHVAELLGVLDESHEPVVLVGHSYAGCVITVAADQRPDQVSGLLYLDAFVPEDGDSCWSMTNDEQRAWYGGDSGATGLAVAPLPFFDDLARPHPLGSLLQRARLSGRWRSVPRKHYVAARDAQWLEHSPFVGITERLRGDADWTLVELDARHNLLADGPDDVVRAILALA